MWDNEYIDENADIYGKYTITTYMQIDIADVTDNFLGVKTSKIINYGSVVGMGIFVYGVELYDRFGGEEAERIWSTASEIKSFGRDTAILDKFSDSIDGDINGDEVVDTFDCLIIKGIYFDSYEATEDEIKCADMNADGEIDMFDYLEVKKIYFEQ